MRFEDLFAGSADDPAHFDPEWRFRALEAAIHAFDGRPPPDAANVEAFIDLARTFDPHLRQITLLHLLGQFREVLAVTRWIDLARVECDGEGRVEMLIGLAEALRDENLDPGPAIRALLAYLDTRPCSVSALTFRALEEMRPWIAPEAGLARWTELLHEAAAGGVWRALHVLGDELPGVLVWLAGSEAPLWVGRALARSAARAG